MSRHGVRKAILAVGLVFLLCSPAGAADKEVVTEGSSAFSKEDAIRQAQRAAVEEAVGVFIKSETEIKNFALKKDEIYSRTQGYITRFEVLNATTSGKVHQVTIRATVSLDKIKDDLVAMKILLESMQRPTVVVLVEEDFKGMEAIGMNIAGTELASLLTAKGFDLVDQEQIKKANALSEMRQAMAGDVNAAQALGLHFDSQYVIVGKAVAQDVGEAFPGSGMRSVQASLQLKVIQTQTGLVLGSVVKNGVAAHISPLSGATIALQKSARSAVEDYLVNAITNSFQDYLNNGQPLKIHVTGVGSFQKYKQVMDAVEGLQDVVSAKKEGWNKSGGLLILDLRFKGSSEKLAEMLDGRKTGSGRLSVSDFAPERVDLTLQ